MRSQNQIPMPWTARVEINNNTRTNFKSLNNRKIIYDDYMQSISPWEVNQFSSLKRNAENQKSKMKEYSKKYRNKKMNKNYWNQQYRENPQNARPQKSKRTKTQTQHNSQITRIRLNTIQVANNLNVLSNQKYFSQDCQKRKMSMTKFRENFIQTSRKKNNQLFLQTKAQIQKKINGRLSTNIIQHSRDRPDDRLIKKLKTIQNENETPLMFFFEAKSSKNMMEREKNIIKIRNICKKTKRLNTDQFNS